MSAKALAYAEQTLKVHEVFEETTAQLSTLDVLTTDLDKALDRKRELAEKYEDRYVQLLGEKRGTHPEMSDTGFKTRLREWEREDPELAIARNDQMAVASEIQGLEFDIDMCKVRLRVGSARMEELGGYLHYLAAVKQAENANNKTQEST